MNGPDDARSPLTYRPEFRFDPHDQSARVVGPTVDRVRQDIANALAADIEGKIAAGLVALGWTPPPGPAAILAAARGAFKTVYPPNAGDVATAKAWIERQPSLVAVVRDTAAVIGPAGGTVLNGSHLVATLESAADQIEALQGRPVHP
jgi:hypothetical protein